MVIAISAIELAVQLKKLTLELNLFATDGKSFDFGSTVSKEVTETSEIVTNDVEILCAEKGKLNELTQFGGSNGRF